MAASRKDLTAWNGFEFRRKMESFGDRDQAVVTVGPRGDIEGIWQVAISETRPAKDPHPLTETHIVNTAN